MSSRSGQSLIESCIVIIILCLIVFGVAQRSQLYMALEILDHAAVCGAHAHAVGLNDFMVQKSVRIVVIPLAGEMTQPSYSPSVLTIPNQHRIGSTWDTAVHFHGGSTQSGIEISNMEDYLLSQDWGEAAGYLDYKLDYLNRYGWTADNSGTPTKTPNIERTVRLQNIVNAFVTEDSALVTATVTHDFPLNYAFHRALYSGLDVLSLKGKATTEKHYDLYLQ